MASFAKGNRGRPKGSKNKSKPYKEILQDVFTPEKQRAFWAAVIKDALSGSDKVGPQARKLLAEYAYGKPSQELSVSGQLSVPECKVVIVPPHEHSQLPTK